MIRIFWNPARVLSYRLMGPIMILMFLTIASVLKVTLHPVVIPMPHHISSVFFHRALEAVRQPSVMLLIGIIVLLFFLFLWFLHTLILYAVVRIFGVTPPNISHITAVMGYSMAATSASSWLNLAPFKNNWATFYTIDHYHITGLIVWGYIILASGLASTLNRTITQIWPIIVGDLAINSLAIGTFLYFFH